MNDYTHIEYGFFYDQCKCGRSFRAFGPRITEVRAEADAHMAKCDGTPAPVETWWLSFCDADRPKGEQFLGVILVDAVDLVDAITQTHQAGCNPGGEVKAVPLPPLEDVPEEDRADAAKTYALPRLTLLSKSDIDDPVQWND